MILKKLSLAKPATTLRLVVWLTDFTLLLIVLAGVGGWSYRSTPILIVAWFVAFVLLLSIRIAVNSHTAGHLRQVADIRIADLLDRPVIQLANRAVLHLIRGRVVLVTGAAGSIGSELVEQLLRLEPKEIVLIDQAESALFNLIVRLQQTPTYAKTRLTVQVADVTNAARIQRIVATYRPECIVHAAAYKHVPLMESHPAEAVRVNVIGTKNIVDAAIECGVKKFVLISTDKAVNPTSVMGATKRFAEMYVQHVSATAKTDFITTRFGNVLGSNGSVVSVFQQQIQAGGPVTVTHPDIYRYFMTVSEACHLVLDAAVMGKGGQVLVFDMGPPVRIADLARRMIQLAGYREEVDIKIQFTGLRPGEKLHEEVLHLDETILPTHHPQIKIARLSTPDNVLIEQALLRISTALSNADDSALIRILKDVIPDYRSNNSPYSWLDKSPIEIGST